MQHKQTTKYLLVFILGLILTACSDTKSLPLLSDDAIILAFGDSLTAGKGTSRNNSYPGHLSRKINRTVINAGINGEISSNGLKRLPALLDKHQPGLLILCHGGNDIIRKLDKSRLKQNLKSMIGLAQARDIPVILMAVPQPTVLLSDLNIYRELADEYDIPIEAEIIADVLSDNGLKSDLIHPNEQGYEMIADALQKLLQESGAI